MTTNAHRYTSQLLQAILCLPTFSSNMELSLKPQTKKA